MLLVQAPQELSGIASAERDESIYESWNRTEFNQTKCSLPVLGLHFCFYAALVEAAAKLIYYICVLLTSRNTLKYDSQSRDSDEHI